jgi:subtilase family serine protease
MLVHKHPSEPRTYYSPDAEPTIDLQATVWHVSGLDNFALPRARVHSRPATAARPLTTTGACPGNSYCGSDMRAAYYGGTALTGAGQSVGLVEYAGYDAADLVTYFSNAGQTNNVPVNGISTDGLSVTCLYAQNCDDTEQVLDITQALGMAPGLAQLNVYVGMSDTAIFSAMSVPPKGSVTGKVDAQLSCSWGWGPADPATDDPLFKKFAAQGQSFFTAAGDSGAFATSFQDVYPADDANVTVVGGTDLSTAGPGGAWLYESAWSYGGGGYFTPDAIPIPAWQLAAVAGLNSQSSPGGSATLRNSPDVAAEANFDFYVCADQQACVSNAYGGTSFAAPMWAGYMALVNQQAAQNGMPSVGFLNPAIYALAASSASYAKAFHDVTTGSNGFNAVPGFDLATGLGSPNGAGLIAALAFPPTPAFALATSGTLSVPQAGSGSIKVTSTVSGGFKSAITLAASGVPAGVSLSFNPTSITGAGTSTVSFQVAQGAAAGTYPIVITGTSIVGGKPAAPPASTTVQLTVTVPNFALSANGSLNAGAPGTASVGVTSTATGGFNGAVALQASGAPSGVGLAFSPTTITGGGASTLTVQVATSAPAGVYPITVTGTSGGLTHSVTVTLTVTVPSFTLASNAGTLSLTAGLSNTLTLTATGTGGFSAPVALTAAGNPSGVTVGFSANSIAGTGSSTVTFSAAPSVVAGKYSIVLAGTSATLQKSVTVLVTVGAASFSISSPTSSLNVLQGAATNLPLSTMVTGVLTAPVTWSASGSPTGVAATFSANSTTPPAGVGLTFAVAANAVAGSYPITLTGTSGSVTAKLVLTLIVAIPQRPTFLFGVGATALTLTHGTSTTLTVQSAATGTTGVSVALSQSGLPTGVTASFSAASITSTGTALVTLTAAPTAKAGTSTLNLSGAAGGSTQTSTVSLTVN